MDVGIVVKVWCGVVCLHIDVGLLTVGSLIFCLVVGSIVDNDEEHRRFLRFFGLE